MESDSWSDHFSFKRLHSARLSPSDDRYIGLEGLDGADGYRAEFPCSFCSEDFDIIGLCCHIEDKHPVEAKNGICPVCATRVGMDMVGHITMQHGHFDKMHRRRRFRKRSSGSHSTLSLLRKELREGHLQSLFGGSSANAAPDPLLSFINNLPLTNALGSVKPSSLDEGISVGKNSDKKAVKSIVHSVSDKDQKEKAQRSDFVQEILLSTFLDDVL